MAVHRRIGAGDVVAGYEIDALVGRGGMGDVYRAFDARLERPVALKLLGERLTDDEAFRERMLTESRLAAGLDHPNVVPIYEAGEADGRLFIAMRYVEGVDLKALLRREGALAPERAVAIASQVADALDAAHAKGLVHRDVKPSNVLLDQERGREHVYLADFGLTQSVSDTRPTDGHLMGTVDYVAPEQIVGDHVDGRADVYALGCLLFESLTGTLPFTGASDVAVVYAHLEQPPPRATDRRPALPPAVDDVLARAMAKDPEARQPSCGALVEETREALGLVTRETTRRRLAVIAALGAAALAAAVAATVVLATRDGAPAAVATGGSLVRIDPASNDVTASYVVSAYPGVVTTASDRVWLGDFRDGSLWRLDPKRGDLQRFTTTGEPRDLTSLGGKIYVAGDGDTLFAGTVTRYDAVTGNRESGVPVAACSVAGGDGVLWAAGCPFVDRLSTGSGQMRVIRQGLVPFQQPKSAETTRNALRDMAVGEGALWVLGDPVDRRVFRVDRHTGDILGVTSLPVAPRSIAAGEGGVWVTGPIDDVLVRLDRTGRRLQVIDVGRGASGIAVGDGAVWVACALDREVWRIDPVSGNVEARIPVDGAPREVAVGAGGIWVTADAG